MHKNKPLNLILVGGAVRDFLSGKKARDYDIILNDTSFKQALRLYPWSRLVGKEHQVLLVGSFELSLPQKNKTTDKFDLQYDLTHRDFTINCFAIDQNGELLCHPNSLEDLHNKILRIAYKESLQDDPLRIFRAARFLTTLSNYNASSSLYNEMKEASLTDKFKQISAERVSIELLKALKSKNAGNFLLELNKSSCLNYWFQEFNNSDQIPAGPPKYHECSVLKHTAQIMNNVSTSLTKWMALCHDLGKTTTQKKFLPTHYGHDKRGIKLAENLGKRLKLPNKYIDAGVLAAKLHMKCGLYKELTTPKKVDLLLVLHKKNLLKNMMELVKADRGVNVMQEAPLDLQTILKVKLPAKYENLGKKSGLKLRELQANALNQKN